MFEPILKGDGVKISINYGVDRVSTSLCPRASLIAIPSSSYPAGGHAINCQPKPICDFPG